MAASKRIAKTSRRAESEHDRVTFELARAQRKIDDWPKSVDAFRKMAQSYAFDSFAFAWLFARNGRGGFRLSTHDVASLQIKLHEAEGIVENAKIVLDPAARAGAIAELRAPAAVTDSAFQAFLASAKAAEA